MAEVFFLPESMINPTGKCRRTSLRPPVWSLWVEMSMFIFFSPLLRRKSTALGPASRSPPSMRIVLPMGDTISSLSPRLTLIRWMYILAGIAARVGEYNPIKVFAFQF